MEGREVSDAELSGLRRKVREFLDKEIAAGTFVPSSDPQVGGFSPEFSRKVGGQGWIGMTWPARYGGGERSSLERYVVCEELLAGGAPVGAHWSADRQIGPGLLKYGSEEQRQFFLPRVTEGRCFFALGFSEPEAGSDLASIRARARRVDDGWVLNGRKIWTSHGHEAHYIVVLCRTSDPDPDSRHAGLSQFFVKLDAPGVMARPIRTMDGKETFSEVVFEDVRLAENAVFGTLGDGWAQMTTELAHERSGPERFLSAFQLLLQLVRMTDLAPSELRSVAIGRMVARLSTLRQMSYQVAAGMATGSRPGASSVLVKDLGTVLEGEMTNLCRLVAPRELGGPTGERFEELLEQATLAAPSFTLRGGTTEILRGIIARNLGVR